MRKMLVMRGPPGVGKTTLIRKMGLERHALSMDSIRMILASQEMGADGKMMVSQQQNQRVADFFFKMIDERMARGETLVLDAMFPHARDFKAVKEKASLYGYDLRVLDMSGVDDLIVRARNDARPETTRLPARAMDRIIAMFANPFSVDLPIFSWSADGSHEREVAQWLDMPSLDLSRYDKVMFIGDIQGCATPLLGPGGVLEHGLDDQVFYVFMGDFLDRGPENGQVLRFVRDHVVGRENTLMMFGNHEHHLKLWANGQAPVSSEFRDKTLPQLIEAGLTPEDARLIVDACVEAIVLEWRGQNILVTHAGLPGVPTRLDLMSTRQLTHGTGTWEDPVDAQFERNAPAGWWQVHGHRNHGGRPVIASSNSINLEDGVEGGGNLRAVVLDQTGWAPIEVRNNTFIPWRNRRRHRNDTYPSWMKEPSAVCLPEETLSLMREHPGVMEKVSQSYPHVASLNFTRQVFFDKQWDDVVVKARGMFFDRDTLEVVARGYDKFFNLGERPETSLDALGQTLAFPVVAFVKENGYLGNVGFDSRSNDLFIATKSTPDGDFSEWFREIFASTLGSRAREKLRRFLRDFEASAVFEVIDPVRDPHMIEYVEPKLVLLDVFHRAPDNRRLPYEELKGFAATIGIEVKRRAFEFKDINQLRGYMASVESDLSWRHKGEDIEGFVLEDKKGFMTKIKLPHYAFWKRMRSVKDRVARLRDQKEEILARPNQSSTKQALATIEKSLENTAMRDKHPLAQAFSRWCLEQPVDLLRSNSIIDLRRVFETEVKQDPSWRKTPWVAFAEPSPQSKKKVKP